MNHYVLACDDDEGIVDIIRIVLEERGYDIQVTTKSEQVLDLIKQKKPDLILMDLWMPRLRGEEIVKKLKDNPDTAAIPIIVISASRDTVTIAKQIGADDYLSKPFDIEDLEKMVDGYLQQ